MEEKKSNSHGGAADGVAMAPGADGLASPPQPRRRPLRFVPFPPAADCTHLFQSVHSQRLMKDITSMCVFATSAEPRAGGGSELKTPECGLHW